MTNEDVVRVMDKLVEGGLGEKTDGGGFILTKDDVEALIGIVLASVGVGPVLNVAMPLIALGDQLVSQFGVQMQSGLAASPAGEMPTFETPWQEGGFGDANN